MSTILILALAVGGGFVFYKMIRKSLETKNKTGLAITGIIMVLVAMVIVAAANGAGHKHVAEKNTTPHFQEQQSKSKTERPTPTPEELEAKRLTEEKQAAEREVKRQQEAEEKRRREEEYAAREAERAANRLTVAEFEGLFLDKVSNIFRTMGVADYATIGEPTQYTNGERATLIYPLDETSTMKMKLYVKNGGVTGLTINTNRLSHETLFSVAVLYNVAALQVFSVPSEAEANKILAALSLDDTVIENLKKPQSITLNGYRYSKESSDSNFALSVVEQ